MSERRWVNPSQPQTLQIGVFLLYINGFFWALAALTGGGLLSLAFAAGQAGGAYGIANEKRWGYQLGVAMSFAPFILRLALFGPSGVFAGLGIINLMFDIALIALLLHRQSRDYQRIWFS